MSRNKPKRRWLQFSLRSVLLLTLAVALWLGYEVHQARQVERTIAGLAALGGNAECELTGWSLLRLCRVPGYGRRIVRAEIPGSAVEEAIGLLRDAPGLREVQVTYDGRYDPSPSWKALIAALPRIIVQPRTEEERDDEDEAGVAFWHRRIECFNRFADRLRQAYPAIFLSNLWMSGTYRTIRYRLVRLPDDSLAEIVSERGIWNRTPTTADCLAILMVDDKCVGIRGFSTKEEPLVPEVMLNPEVVFEDLDGDGFIERGFALPQQLAADPRIRHLPGDSRYWLGVYKIERDGFKSLLPDDLSEFPNADGDSLVPPAHNRGS